MRIAGLTAGDPEVAAILLAPPLLLIRSIKHLQRREPPWVKVTVQVSDAE